MKETYRKNISKSSAVGIDRINQNVFSKRLDSEIDIIFRKLHSKTYKFSPYKLKLISKGAKKFPREISIPTIRDRITLKNLCNLLMKLYEEDVSLVIPQIRIQEIKELIEIKKYDGFIKLDMENFYPSIDHELLLKTLKRKIRKKELISLIEKAIKNITIEKPKRQKWELNKQGVPQGLSISNILAEIFIHKLDTVVQEKSNLRYFRYVDDILILCNSSEAKRIGSDVVSILTSEKYKLKVHSFDNHGKSIIGKIEEGFSFLGYSFKGELVSIKKDSILKFENSIVKVLSTYKYQEGKSPFAAPLKVLEWRLNLKITGCVFEQQKRGWLFYFSQMNDLQILYSIDKTIESLLKRFGLFGKISPKKISKAYFETKRKKDSKNNYITNFDNTSIQEKRVILNNFIDSKYNLDSRSDEEIDNFFGKRIKFIIRELEEDISEFS